MILHDITMVCGDTSRARCYLQALTARNLNPAACIVLPDEGKPLPGQNAKGNAVKFKKLSKFDYAQTTRENTAV